jgi:flagellar motor switch protein FliM
MVDLHPELRDIESNPLFMQVVPPSDMSLLITLEARIGSLSGILNVLYPYVLLEPILSLLSAQTLYAVGTRSASAESRERTRRVLNDVMLPLTLELGEADLTLRELLGLERGDVVVLNKCKNDELSLKVEGLEKFRCRPGLVGKQRGARITGVLGESEIPPRPRALAQEQ